MKRTIITSILSAILVLFLIFILSVPYGFTLESPIEDALLKRDWGKVIELLKKDDKQANDPVARLIMGHASLAINKNNESMLLFLSVKDESDLKLWSEWADSLLRKNPKNPIALYFSGDAKARIGKVKEAEEMFTKAIEVKSDFALPYNARGVISVLNNKWDEALINFYQATRLAPDFADAYANLGTYWILREAPEGALEAFNKALTINSEFALAYNGRGTAYFGKGEFENAAEDFSTASQLNPVLVVSEINQGFASAYASKLITLASVEKKPGTTFESINQQYPDVVKEQQQQLLKMLPTQKDQEFWKKMDALPWILQSNEKTQALIKEYGLQKVQMSAFLKMQEYKSQIAETNQKVQTLYNTISSYDKKIWNLRVAESVTSLGFSALGTATGLKEVPQKGWEYFALKTEIRTDKAFLSSTVSNPTLKTVIDAIPLSLNPIALGGGITSSGLKIGRSVLEDKRDAVKVEFENLSSQVPVWGAQLRAIETNLGRLGGTSITTQSPIKSPSQIPGYYTSTDRPLTEIGALASMVDKSITKPTGGSSRRALVVAQDPFRATIQQQELWKYGFETKVISPTMNAQAEAKQWGADVILGIRETREMKSLQAGNIPIDDPSKKYYDDIKRKIPPPFPPDKGGGAAGIGTQKMLQPQNWDWGKPYVPTYSKGAPGGISTEEIAKAFVDKGNWPVMTSFSLFYFYKSELSTEEQNVKEDK